MQSFESCIYEGEVMHQRTVPRVHRFSYSIYLWFLKLSEVEDLASSFELFHAKPRGLQPFRFDQSDYIQAETGSLSQRALNKMSELAGTPLEGDVFLLGQMRSFGLYFSPVNFYFLRNAKATYTHMLAEVSNTPWNERHYYLVDMLTQENTQKAFHVSPFNPMDMIYKWQIKPPAAEMHLHLSCYKQNKHFEAAIDMQRININDEQLSHLKWRVPSMTIKTLAGIYWQALKLFIKRVPIYSHPDVVKQKGNNDVA